MTARPTDFADAWDLLIEDLDAVGDEATRVGQELHDRHREPVRSYHAVEHVEAVLANLARLDARTPVTELAAFFHDAIYDPRASDNEEASAQLAEHHLGALGVDDGVIAATATIIRATAGHALPDDAPAGTAEFLDADLSMLGASPERYGWYAQAIRDEYAHVPNDAFRAGRAAMLTNFVEREQLFLTDAGVALWDAAARRNLKNELAELRSS